MEQESIYNNIGVIGCGAAGGFFSILASKNPYNIITAFDVNNPLSTLLPTGGGRCNLTYDEDDIKELVKNYPRGNKFLLSVFYRLSPQKTRLLFSDLGIKTYIQSDKRVFPITDSSEKTVKILLNHLNTSNFNYKKEKVISVSSNNNFFEVKTTSKCRKFNKLVIASGGRGMEIAKSTGHNIIPPHPSLTALDINEKYLYSLSGICLKNVEIKSISNGKKISVSGDILFTHKSISGPVVFKLSALTAFDDFNENSPLEITVKLADCTLYDIDNEIKNNPKKNIKNIFSKFIPENFISLILLKNNIDGTKQAAQIKKSEKEILINSVFSLKLHVTKRIKGSEIVTAGGIDLNEINPKTMESKLIPNLFFIGEVLNIDGYTGGFNLQNCWSTAYICSLNI